MKIYISGKVTGLDPVEARKKFIDAEMKLKQQGYEVINPYAVNMMLPHDTTWKQYMDVSIVLLNMCDAIYMLSDWLDSPGAMMEYNHAVSANKKVMFEKKGETEDEE